MNLLPGVAIQPDLELKTRAKQLLGSLPLVIVLPAQGIFDGKKSTSTCKGTQQIMWANKAGGHASTLTVNTFAAATNITTFTTWKVVRAI